MSTLQSVLTKEIRRLARKEIRAELDTTRRTVAQHRREIAELKRRNTDLEKTVNYLESREARRLKEEPLQADVVPDGTRFSSRSLRAQRRRSGLSRDVYASLVGVSSSTIYNWESGATKPSEKHLATLVSLRGLGKREARKRMQVMEG
jgi:DNA-binding transcriptional regulator YiaG